MNSFNSIINSFNLKNLGFYTPQAPYKIDNNKFSWAFQRSDQTWQIDEAKQMFQQFFKKIVLNRHDPNDVYVIGFSQGASVCYEIITYLDCSIGGIFPIAGFIRSDKTTYFDNINPNILSMPVVIGHGIMDNIVSPNSSKKAFKMLRDRGMKNVKINFYNGGHKINIKFLEYIKEIIKD